MKNLLKILLLLYIGIITFTQAESKFHWKDIKDFKTLKQFNDIEEFEQYIDVYTQECLDNGYGGTGSISCLISYEIWDKELNIAYKELYSRLDKNGKNLLKKSQRKWLDTRSLDLKMTQYAVPNDGEGGTAQQLIVSMHIVDTMKTIVKARTLLLKLWIDKLNVETKLTEGE